MPAFWSPCSVADAAPCEQFAGQGAALRLAPSPPLQPAAAAATNAAAFAAGAPSMAVAGRKGLSPRGGAAIATDGDDCSGGGRGDAIQSPPPTPTPAAAATAVPAAAAHAVACESRRRHARRRATGMRHGLQPAPPPAPQPAPPPAGPPPGPPPPRATSVLLAISPSLPSSMWRDSWSLADFYVVRRLYRGYAASVYHAVDRRSGAHVALKVYGTARLDALTRRQLMREIALHARLRHPNIIELLAAFAEPGGGGDVVLVLEFAAGGDVCGLLQRAGGRLDERQAAEQVLRPFLSALAYIHTQGIAHRDVKPENLLLTASGAVKLADFGLAIDLREERAVTRAGTLDYMAPEVLRCPPKVRPDDHKACEALGYGTSADAYAVGVLAYELIVGFPPFVGGGGGRGEREAGPGGTSPRHAANGGGGGGADGGRADGVVAFTQRMSAPARAFVSAALRRHPGDRPTAAEMSASSWIAGTAGAPAPAPAPPSPPPPPPRVIISGGNIGDTAGQLARTHSGGSDGAEGGICLAAAAPLVVPAMAVPLTPGAAAPLVACWMPLMVTFVPPPQLPQLPPAPMNFSPAAAGW